MSIINVSSNLVPDVVGNDIMNKFQHLVQPGGGYYVDPETNKIRSILIGVGVFHPWIHIRHDYTRPCVHCHMFFNAYKMIPNRCMSCWKVVVAPNTVVQLFNLYDLMVELDHDSKLGIENRKFVPRNYGAYFYQNTLEEGQERYEEIRKMVDKELSPDIPVSLKRYCTEFEIQKGPSKAYNRPKEADHWEKLFWNAFHIDDEWPGQPDIVRRHIMRSWMEFAWDRGDMTVMELNNGDPLYTLCNTYHKEIE